MRVLQHEANFGKQALAAARHLIRRNSVLRSQHHRRAKITARRVRIDDTNAKEIKGFPPCDRSRALKLQHNFANMCAGLHAPVCISGVFQRESAVHQGLDAAFSQ